MSLFESASLVVTPNGTKASKLYAIKPTSGAGDLTVTRATTATRVNSSGLIESVGTNVPRLDYTNGTCPSILVEPQRTNLFLYSEQFDNSYWDPFNINVIANVVNAPNNELTADKLLDTTSNSAHFFYKSFTLASDTTFSWFVKSAEYSKCCIENYSDGGRVVFDINNSLVVSSSGNFSNAKIESYANGFKRISATHTSSVSNKFIGLGLINNSNQDSFIGTGTSGIYVWGAQREAGSYATSYIPTVASAVTRNADVISKTGISSLIGQAEGTVYWEGVLSPLSSFNSLISLEVKNSIFVNLRVNNLNKIEVGTSGLSNDFAIVSTNSILPNTFYKVAFSYKSGQNNLYINGVLAGSNSVTYTIPTLSQFRFNVWDIFDEKKNINTSVIWKTQLTNAELIELTSL